MDKSIIFRHFFFSCGPCFDLHDHQIGILKKLDFDRQLYGLLLRKNPWKLNIHLDTCLTTIITTIQYIYTVDASKIMLKRPRGRAV